MLSEEQSTDMDRITQLQDAILDLLTIAATSIDYITHRTQFEQTSAAIPTTLHTAQAARRAEYRASITAFVSDLTTRSKHVEALIAALPTPSTGSSTGAGTPADRLRALQAEVVLANAEYRDAMGEAERVLAELEGALAAAFEPTSEVKGMQGIVEA
ncbi:Subunit of heteropentameric Replication factor C (RF-C) [Cryptotrichosporon argae]